MGRVRSFGHFWYDFIVGDDWRLAVASAAALGLCGLFSHLNLTSWWLVPAVIVATLTLTLVRTPVPAAARSASTDSGSLPWSDDAAVTPPTEVDE
jgi:hypothetical protein